MSTSSQERVLPLFPLNVVLFPGGTQPLHIFEERYKLMVQRCLDGDSQFGIVLIKEGQDVGAPATPFDVGTVGHIESVKKEDDGRMYLAVQGQERFRVVEVVQEEPYLEGRVAPVRELDDRPLDESEIAALRESITGYVRLLMGLHGGWTREVEMPDDLVELSWYVARMLQCGLPEKQGMLETPGASDRLRYAKELLDQGTAELKARVARRLTRGGSMGR